RIRWADRRVLRPAHGEARAPVEIGKLDAFSEMHPGTWHGRRRAAGFKDRRGWGTDRGRTEEDADPGQPEPGRSGEGREAGQREQRDDDHDENASGRPPGSPRIPPPWWSWRVAGLDPRAHDGGQVRPRARIAGARGRPVEALGETAERGLELDVGSE